ncbi:TolC family protein [Pedobacter sp. L105]|uniref:TolC family protein n=1 Tax=Pedobacter sp. L105 TaxID=1641871 RepID=UPI00131DB7CF|nr:TolC family protein [Pedobacter sp. L105]
MKTRKLLQLMVVVCLMGWSTGLFAQDSLNVSPGAWHLQKCLDYARKNNIQLNSLRLDQKTSQQELLLSKSAVLPGLSGSASQNYAHGKNLDVNTGNYQSGFTPSGSYSLNSSVVLYQGGYLKNDIQQKNLSLQSANLSVQEQENNITLTITQSYLNILLDKETIIYEEEIVNTSQAQLDNAKQKLVAGSIAGKDVAQLESQLANDKYTLVSAKNTRRQDLLALKQLLQLPISYSLEIVDPDTVIAKKAVPALNLVVDNAMSFRPEVRISELGVESANISLAKAKTGFKPTLTANGSVGSSYAGTTPGYFRQLNNYFNQQVGITLSVPIFSKRVTKTNVEEAKINIDQAVLTLQDTKTTLSQNVEKSYINVLTAESQYDAAAEALRYNKETYRIADEQLSLGATAMVDFLQQKALYVQALQNFIQAKYNAALTIEIYDFYNGVPVQL